MRNKTIQGYKRKLQLKWTNVIYAVPGSNEVCNVALSRTGVPLCNRLCGPLKEKFKDPLF